MLRSWKRLSAILAILAGGMVAAEEAPRLEDLIAIDARPLDRSLQGGVVSYARSLQKVRPAVVSVYAKSFAEGSPEASILEKLWGHPSVPRTPALGLGSGVIVSENGYILTNNHVVSFADELTVQLDGNRIFDAEVVGTDPQSDLAVIKIDATDLPAAVFADSEAIEVGDVVFAIGNPLGLGKTVTMGIVSATGRHQLLPQAGAYEDFIQTDAPINTGNSGGALVDAWGRLVGINTMIQTDGRSTGNIGIGFAVPANMARWVMGDLLEKGAVSRGFLGVGIEALDRQQAERYGVASLEGALVRQVAQGSPASEAGFEVGDIIIGVNDQAIESPNDLRLTISRIKPGTEISVRVVRNEQEKALSVVLAELGKDLVAEAPPMEPTDFLPGVEIEDLTNETREAFELDASLEGVVVVGLDDDSAYGDKLSVGMVIVKINGHPVTDASIAGNYLVPGKRNMLHIAFKGVHRWVSIDYP